MSKMEKNKRHSKKKPTFKKKTAELRGRRSSGDETTNRSSVSATWAALQKEKIQTFMSEKNAA